MNHAARGTLAKDPVFLNRIAQASVAVASVIFSVADPGDGDPVAKAQWVRRRVACQRVFRDPEWFASRTARAIAASPSITVPDPMEPTDATLNTLIAEAWDNLALAFEGMFG
jgi:hypothetical protein